MFIALGAIALFNKRMQFFAPMSSDAAASAADYSVAWQQATPAQWPSDLPLPPGCTVLNQLTADPDVDSIGMRIACEMSPLGLAAYFDALSASAGFLEAAIEASDEALNCLARQALRTLSLRMQPDGENWQGELIVVNERNLLFNPRRSYLYAYGRRVCGCYPPGFPSSILCPLPNASLVFAQQRGSAESSLGQHTMAVTGVVHDFYKRHLLESGFRNVLSSERPENGGMSSVFGRQDEVARIESYPFQGWLRVECHFSATGSSNIYERGWR